MTDGTLEAVLRRDRLIVACALGGIFALAWAYVLWLAADMNMGSMDMSGLRMIPAGIGWMAPANAPWSGVEFAFVFAMWAVMMVGMMAPSAAPMILMYARVGRQASSGGKPPARPGEPQSATRKPVAGTAQPFAATAWFTSGYFLAWIGFSLAATGVQWVLEREALLNPSMASASSTLGAVVLIAAGVYQWTPLKDVCLTQCRTPFSFLMLHGGFRGDVPGCVGLGLRHGAYCVGCCWVLMALLFVVGVMNVLWIALLALLVLLEKLMPWGRWVARAAGLACVGLGIWMVCAGRANADTAASAPAFKLNPKRVLELQTEVDGYARASKLPALQDGGPDELRLWVSGFALPPVKIFFPFTMGYELYGHAVSSRGALTCRVKIGLHSRASFGGECKPDKHASISAPVAALIAQLAKYSSQAMTCGVTDGVSFSIEGISAGRRFVLESFNPQDCPGDEGSKLLLRVVTEVFRKPAEEPLTGAW